MSDVCDKITCDQAELSLESLLALNFAYWNDGSIRSPLAQTTEKVYDSEYFSCDVFISARAAARELFQSNYLIRIVFTDGFSPLTCDDLLTIETLFRMALVKTSAGCTAIRVIEVDPDDSLDCDDSIGILSRMRSSFLISDDKTKTAIAVTTKAQAGSDYIRCEDNNSGEMSGHISRLLTIISSDGSYIVPISII